MATSDNKVYLNWGEVDDGSNDLLVNNGYQLTTETGLPVTDPQGDVVADWEAFNANVVGLVTGLKTVGTNGIKPEAGSFHNLLFAACPNWPFDPATTNVPEEKAMYERMIKTVSRYTATGITGKVQQALNKLPGGKIVLRGTIMTKNGEVDGCWLSTDDAPTGAIQNTIDGRLDKAFKGLKPARDYINLITSKRQAVAAQTLISLDNYEAKHQAEFAELRAGVALRIKAISAKSGNGAAPDEADEASDDE